MGVGAKPIIAGYESQLIEFAAAQPDAWRQLEGRKLRPVVLYPEPTVYSSHVLLALDATGRRLLEALRDPELQALAWQRHGFRSGTSMTNSVGGQAIAGLPEVVEKVVPLPPRDVMDRCSRPLVRSIPHRSTSCHRIDSLARRTYISSTKGSPDRGLRGHRRGRRGMATLRT